ncbi:MAG: asparagine synthase (glutamine-hydrolyzing) [Cytophagales bacterium]
MCRISGILSSKYSENQLINLVQMMNDALVHGGPDDEGVYASTDDNLVFGHRRLSLIDLTPAGHQPMQSDHLVITFNGEIYNFKEIKRELIALGIVFTSHSDTEVILKSFLHWGEACFSKFNGMFAFALLDKKSHELYLVRNANAVKPLYYYLKSEELIFSSEIRSFLALPIKWLESQDWKLLFLVFGHLPEPATTLKDVKVLPKGSFLKINCITKKHSQHKFNFESKVAVPFTFEEAKQMVRHEFTAAVRRNLISDAPIGIFLSGGIDSSIIALAAHEVHDAEINTLSVTFDDAEFSEKQFQDKIKNRIGSHHFNFNINYADFNTYLADIQNALDQPTTDGINTYFISKLAQKVGLKAVLSGLGADEIFGGYPSFQRNPLISLLSLHPRFAYKFYKFATEYKNKKIEYLQIDDLLGKFLLYRSNYSPSEIAKILPYSEKEIFETLKEYYVGSFGKELSIFEQTAFFETNLYMQNQLLKDTDVMSMWHGVEVRVPFLDDEFLALVNQIPTAFKTQGERQKDLLISAFEDVLPREIWDRPKQGFLFPFKKWMKKREIVDEMLNHKNPYIKQLTNRFQSDKLEWSRFWSLYVINVFDRKHFKIKNMNFEVLQPA